MVYVASFETAAGRYHVDGHYRSINAAHAAARMAARDAGYSAFDTLVFPHSTAANVALMISAIVLTLAVCSGFFMLAWSADAAEIVQPACRIIAIDSKGDAFVAGSGDTLADAWEGVVLPADWRTIYGECDE